MEMEAVRYFQGKFVKKGERQMAIKSLAGHLSQASLGIRQVVGPQLQFKSWLSKHPHIFEVCGDEVRLQDDVAAMVFSCDNNNWEIEVLRQIDNKQMIDLPLHIDVPCRSTFGIGQCNAEFMAIVFMLDLVKNGGFSLDEVSNQINVVPLNVQKFIDDANIQEFLERNSNLFDVRDRIICTAQREKFIEVSEKTEHGVISGKGKIYHIAKLWGIIDLGQHDHVFFDRSILAKCMVDLKKEYKVGEVLCFNAGPAPQTSRAKWKASKVWKPFPEQEHFDSGDQLTNSINFLKIENEFLKQVHVVDNQNYDEECSEIPRINDNVGSPEGEGNWMSMVNCKKQDSEEAASLEQSSDSSSEDEDLMGIKKETNCLMLSEEETEEEKELFIYPIVPKKGVSVACQTVSTGDIISKKEYREV